MFRSFRRSGPTPFQVMSSSWRGPTRPSAKPAAGAGAAAEAGAGAGAETAAQPVAVEASAIQMPAGPLKIKETQPEVVRKTIETKQADKPQPKATIQVRGHTDSPVVKKDSKAAEIGARLRTGIIQGATVLGGLTLALGAVIKDRSVQVGKRLGLVGDKGRSRSRHDGLPRQTVVIGFAALALTIVIIAWALSDRGAQVLPPLGQQNETNVRDENLSSLLPGVPAAGSSGNKQERQGDRSSVVPPVGARTDAIPFGVAPGTAPGAVPGTTPGKPKIDDQPKPKLSRTSTDPREKGQRYYILATYSVNKEEYLMPLLEYLWSQGVEAGAINGHNSGFFQVISLAGFTRDEINSNAHKQYEESLRRLGRKWKAQGGGDDLQGLYLQEYSGTQAKQSIMKAN